MAVQRKVFRIEEHARAARVERIVPRDAEGALRHREFMAELQALRALIEPRATGRAATRWSARARRSPRRRPTSANSI